MAEVIAHPGHSVHSEVKHGYHHDHPKDGDDLIFQYHDNSVHFYIDYNNKWLWGGNFWSTECAITPGQDPQNLNTMPRAAAINITPGKDYNTVDFGFKVGRQKSGTVADFFNGKIKSYENTFGHGAGELNFAFFGSMSVTVGDQYKMGLTKLDFNNVCLAQGSSGSTNNWWIGIQGATKVSGKDQITAKATTGQTVTFQRGDSLPDRIWITNIDW